MNTRKIWILAIFFGLLMSLSFLFLTTLNQDRTEEAIESSEDEEEVNEMSTVLDHSLQIESGKRALSLEVSEIQAVSGFIQPGSYVDIISVITDGPAQLMLDQVKVLAVGKQTSKQEEEQQEPYSMVTLELTAAEATLLTLARENGVLTFILRNSEDQEPSSKEMMTKEQLTKGQMR